MTKNAIATNKLAALFTILFPLICLAQEPPKPILYASMENSGTVDIARGRPDGAKGASVDGKVRKAQQISGRGAITWFGIGNIDLNRGTMALFFRSDKPVQRRVWGTVGPGVQSSIQGYWGVVMAFNMLGERYGIDLLDISRYGQRLTAPSPVDRWKENEWVHLALVWDRNYGLKYYENGKLIASNWQKNRWAWNSIPTELAAGRGDVSIDEVYVYVDCLTDAQVAELAAGKAPTVRGWCSVNFL